MLSEYLIICDQKWTTTSVSLPDTIPMLALMATNTSIFSSMASSKTSMPSLFRRSTLSMPAFYSRDMARKKPLTDPIVQFLLVRWSPRVWTHTFVVRELSIDDWKADKAETQYQAEGSSHELASLLLTECIQHSLYSAKKPIYILYLDAESAFDNVIRQLLVRKLYLAGTDDQTLIYINRRLESRDTFLDWNKKIMGPIHDEKGVEQGGVNSDHFYKNILKGTAHHLLSIWLWCQHQWPGHICNRPGRRHGLDLQLN